MINVYAWIQLLIAFLFLHLKEENEPDISSKEPSNETEENNDEVSGNDR